MLSSHAAGGGLGPLSAHCQQPGTAHQALNYSVSNYYTVKSSSESEEQEISFPNPGMAFVLVSAPFWSSNPSPDERGMFALEEGLISMSVTNLLER